MSADPQSFDPYRSPSLPEGPYAATPSTGRPGLLTTLCVLTIVLGALGILNSLIGCVGAIGGQMIQKAIQPTASAGMPQDMQDAQAKFQDDVNAVQKKYFAFTIPALAVRFVVALLLLIGGIRCLGLSEPGRKLLLVACGAAVVFELLHGLLQSIITLDTMTAVNSYVESLTETMPNENGGPDMRRLMPAIVRGSIIGGLVFSFAVALAKIALYVFGLVYLQKERIKARFHLAKSPLTSGP